MQKSDSVRGADRAAQALRAAGIETVFAMSGNQVMVLFDAFLDEQIGVVHIRHEAAAVHMAEARAQLTGDVAIALVPAGPGFANALSALYSARMSESPMVLLSGHAPVARIGQGAFQEMPQADMAAHLAKASWTVEKAEDAAPAIAEAMRIARADRPGPVHVALPFDILCAEADGGAVPAADAFTPDQNDLADADARKTLDAIAAASRPLILVGPTFARGRGAEAAKRLEAATGVPVVCSESPRGTNDPCLGAFAEALQDADLVVSVGKRLDFTVQLGAAMAADGSVIHIDPEQQELDRSGALFGNRLTLAAKADALPAAERLIALANAPAVDADWSANVKDAVTHRPAEWATLSAGSDNPLHPIDVCRAVQAKLDASPDAVLIIDGGEFGQWAQACLHAPNRIINGPGGAIGAGIPFSVAAGLTKPGAPVIALMGDGSMGFHLSEFDTAARTNSPFVLIVGNDAKWNAEFQIQLRDFGPQRMMGCELNATRYDQAAVALGCEGGLVTRADEMAPALDKALKSGRPTCLNVSLESHPAPTVRRA
jgi:thiamine pyrophosphate-dependent acetolactate synthase large subunit-like protein